MTPHNTGARARVRPEAPRKADAADRLPPPFINLCGDYRFLRGGYWALVDAELNDVRSRPTYLEAATAQNAAACLLVAQYAGIPTVSWRMARKAEDVEPPALLVPVAGLTDTCYRVEKPRSAESQWRRATQNGTRAVLSVDLPGPLRSMRMMVGVTTNPDFDLAWQVWRAFGIPLATIWYVEPELPEDDSLGSGREGESFERGRHLFLGLDPLPLHDLSKRELKLLEEVSQRPMSPS